MKIVKETSDLIIIKDRNIAFFTIGIIFILTGLSLLTILKPAFSSFDYERVINFAFLFILLGLGAVLILDTITISLDKTSNKLSLILRSIIRKKVKECPLNQIRAIELRLFYMPGEGKWPRLVFILIDGTEFPLPLGAITTTGRRRKRQIIKERNIGPKIATFLNVPFNENITSNINEILPEIRRIFKRK